MIPRLFVPTPLKADQPVCFDAGQKRYLKKTLRLKPGAPLVLFTHDDEDKGRNPDGEWQAELIETETGLGARLLYFQPLNIESPLEVTLVLGLAKGGVTDFIIQKAVELGAHAIIPLVSERTVRRPKADRLTHQMERWQKIILEAAEQCGRVRLPPIHTPASWEELPYLLPDAPRYLFWEEEAGKGETLNSVPHPGKAVTLMIGPEGGFSESEIQYARDEMNFTSLALGPRILRADTAGVAVLSAAQILWGDMA